MNKNKTEKQMII